MFVFWRSLDFYATCLKNATRDDQSMRSAQALVPEAYSIIQRQCSKKSELTWNTYASPKVLVPTEADSEKTVKTGGFWRGFVICLLDFGPPNPGLLSVLNNFLLCVLFHSLAYSNSNSKSRVLLMMLKLVISFFSLCHPHLLNLCWSRWIVWKWFSIPWIETLCSSTVTWTPLCDGAVSREAAARMSQGYFIISSVLMHKQSHKPWSFRL